MVLWQVRIAVFGTPPSAFEEAVPDFREELENRWYLVSPVVVWDESEQRMIVTVGYDADTAEWATGAVADDLSDCVSAYVESWDTSDLDLIDVQPSGLDH